MLQEAQFWDTLGLKEIAEPVFGRFCGVENL